MRKGLTGAGMAFLACILGVRANSPQQPVTSDNPTKEKAAPSPTSSEKIEVPVNLVQVVFTVTDKKNHLVLDLTKDDFRLFEDKRPQTVQFFSRETNLPLRVGVLVDTSNSIRERLHFEQEAAIDFLNDTLRPGQDQAFVVAFDVEPQLLQDYTDDIEKLSNAIRAVQAGGGTGMYDAIYFASKQKMVLLPPPQPYIRRVMILLSDGRDNQSQHSRDEALAMAQRAEVTIFAISTNRSGIDTHGDKVLRYLAEQTGGRAFFPFEARDLEANFQEIARELRSQYSLGYVSTNRAKDGTFRTISLQPATKGLSVRARNGYWAPSE